MKSLLSHRSTRYFYAAFFLLKPSLVVLLEDPQLQSNEYYYKNASALSPTQFLLEDDYVNHSDSEEDKILDDHDNEFAIPKGFKKVGGDMLMPIIDLYSGVFSRNWTRSKTGLIFVFSKRFSAVDVRVLEAAIVDLSVPSCISIRLMNESQFSQDRKSIRNYVFITRNTRQGCYSHVGMQGGRQRLNLDPFGCINKGNTLHEMMHTLGYDHEQSRKDRDEYVTINYRNIRRGYQSNFWISRQSELVGPYDYSSIMHYRADAFAINPRIPTITSKIPGKAIPIRNGSQLSTGDIIKIQAITGCNEESMNNTSTTVMPV